MLPKPKEITGWGHVGEQESMYSLETLSGIYIVS
jgi:hypothetical protein